MAFREKGGGWDREASLFGSQQLPHMGHPQPAVPHLTSPPPPQVLEVWMTWVQMNGIENDGFRAAATQFVAAAGEAMRGMGASLTLAVPPALPSGYRWVTEKGLRGLGGGDRDPECAQCAANLNP